jgi:uncharacterized protein YjgD (DUF1641 family)
MSKLLIEQLTEEVEKTASENTSEQLEKTAEEEAMEKIAHEINVLDQSRTLVAIGEEMYKIAQELENEAFAALAADTYSLGERMGSCLTKTASEDGSALAEALEIAEDMHKVASIYADLADEVKTDETLNKMAEAMINISNELTEDANEFYKMASEETEEVDEEEATSEEVEKEAGVKDIAKKVAGVKDTAKRVADAGVKNMAKRVADAKDIAKKVAYESGFKGMQLREFLEKYPKTVKGVGAAAALAAAGYAGKKIHDKK